MPICFPQHKLFDLLQVKSQICFTVSAIISTSKLSTIVPTPSSTSVNLSSIATFTPAQHRQFLQQAQSLPQQVVMMSGQPPQRLSQAIPINVGTLVANPGNMVNPGMPFVVPSMYLFCLIISIHSITSTILANCSPGIYEKKSFLHNKLPVLSNTGK